MKIKLKKTLAILLALIIALSVIAAVPITASAEESENETETILPTAKDNLVATLRKNSRLVSLNDGYMRVIFDGEKVGVEYYDDDFNIISKKYVEMELPIWGGFYAGYDAYYLVEGQNNLEEDNNIEVIRVIKYDSDWNRIGAAKITSSDAFGGEVRRPFNYGCVEMTEYNGKLYIVTGHEGYVDNYYGQGHQGFLMITIDESKMTGEITECDLWHSFAQYIKNNNSEIYVLEQSDGSRCTSLSQCNAEGSKEKNISVLKYGGTHTSAWAIACYASVDGVELSSDNILCLGTSIDQSEYDNVTYDTAHNIYLTVTPKSDFSESATEIKWLTSYEGEGKSFLGVNITKVNDNRFMISWEETDTCETASDDDTLSGNILHYIFVDGSGNKISDEYTASAPISECQPVIKGSKIVYYASSDNMLNFYSIDSESGAFSKKSYRIAGEMATWNLKDGILTISGTGAISVDTEAKYRYPLSSADNWYSYSSSDNSWMPVRDNVEKIIVSKGITQIADNSFNWFNSLEEVYIEPGMESIGEKAFYSCRSLLKITIPSSVTSIGEDFLWTGYYYISNNKHVVDARIYAPCGSYAINYAKENEIRYNVTEHQFGSWTITKAPTFAEEGMQTRECSACGYTETETIPKIVYTRLLGDINGDEKINLADAVLALKHSLKLVNLTDNDFLAADVDGDGNVQLKDAIILQKYSLGFGFEFPIGEPIQIS